MEITKNKDELSACNNCLSRTMQAEIILNFNSTTVKLCKYCRKELMKKLVDVT